MNHIKAGVYSDPGCGKTRLITSVPDEWGEGVYVSADPSSDKMGSILPQFRSRLHVVRPGWKLDKSGVNQKVDYTIHNFELAMINWKSQFPNLGFIAIDTASHIARRMLNESGLKRTEGSDAATKAAVVVVTGDDYGDTQNRMLRLLELWIEQPLHVLIAFHSATLETKEGIILYGGPATVGQKALKPVAGMVDSLFYMSRKFKPGAGGGKMEYNVYSEPQGVWAAKLRIARTNGTNPMPHVQLEPNPSHLWTQLEKVESENV